MERIDILRDVVVELDRFRKKLALAIKEQENFGDDITKDYHAKDYASCKRAALDLKRELTKITNWKYRYKKIK